MQDPRLQNPVVKGFDYAGNFGVISLKGNFRSCNSYYALNEGAILNAVRILIEHIDDSGKNLAISVKDANFYGKSMPLFSYPLIENRFQGRRKVIIGSDDALRENITIMFRNSYEFFETEGDLADSEITEPLAAAR
jgi:hypothetical protein